MRGFALGSYVGAIVSMCYTLWLHHQGHYWTASEALFCYTSFMLGCACLGLLIDSVLDQQ